ncbi:hypothetical protein HHK36_024777 [Tetracentron sinense]|uniref:Uncharacterized protein n=1 Tax=Tetracentron sinense TaxID=13715 RepID=A0A834YKV7_TETSI|nr:hypothetical protein HHK36_024777 [Tetracentron sinense]
MSLLELITKATADAESFTAQSEFPIILNSDEILRNLKPVDEDSNDISLIKRVGGWKISETDSEIVELGNRFSAKLKRKLKNPKSFDRNEFLGLLGSFLEKNGEKIGLSVGADSSDTSYTRVMIEKLGFLIGRDVAGLILESCLVLELWELLEALIIHGLVDRSSSSNLVDILIKKKRSDLLCLCVKHVSDIRSSDFLCILKHFLSPPKDNYSSMVSVRKEWESQAQLAIEKATNEKLPNKKSCLAKQASILIMIAHDGFSASELCLHYMFASSNFDELAFTSSISRLDGSELLSLIRYLGKWLSKYERFPLAGPCPKAASILGLRACDWVPTLESTAKCLGLVLDEHFSSLVLYSEFHEELRSIEGVVKCLASEARLCCYVANVIENLRMKKKVEECLASETFAILSLWCSCTVDKGAKKIYLYCGNMLSVKMAEKKRIYLPLVIKHIPHPAASQTSDKHRSGF